MFLNEEIKERFQAVVDKHISAIPIVLDLDAWLLQK